VPPEISPGSPGCLCPLYNGIRVGFETSGGQDILNVFGSLQDIALDIHSETWGFWDGKTEVESDTTGNAAKTDKNTPNIIDMVEDVRVIVQNGVLVSSNKNEAN